MLYKVRDALVADKALVLIFEPFEAKIREKIQLEQDRHDVGAVQQREINIVEIAARKRQIRVWILYLIRLGEEMRCVGQRLVDDIDYIRNPESVERVAIQQRDQDFGTENAKFNTAQIGIHLKPLGMLESKARGQPSKPGISALGAAELLQEFVLFFVGNMQII